MPEFFLIKLKMAQNHPSFSGELIIVEKPYATVLYSKFYPTHCLTCFKRLGKTIKDCPGCDQAKFCSVDCQDANRTHWAECGQLDLLQDEELGRMALMVYRILITAGLDKLMEVSKGQKSKNPTYDSEDYCSVFDQVTNEEFREPGDLFKRNFMAFYLVNRLRIIGFLPDQKPFFQPENSEAVTLIGLAIRHLQSCSCNAYEIGEMRHGRSGDENLQLGGAVYATVSLSNHHCVANTARNNVLNHCVVRAAKTILPGDEISDNYGHYYQVKSRTDRQADLKLQYFFLCDCQACRHDWPAYRQLPADPVLVCASCKAEVKKPNKTKKCSKCRKEVKVGKLLRVLSTFHESVTQALSDINDANVDQHLAKFTEILSLIEPNVQHPSKHFVICQQVISQCFAIKSNFSVADWNTMLTLKFILMDNG